MNDIPINVLTLERKWVVTIGFSQFKYFTTVNLLMLPKENHYSVNDNDYDIDVQRHGEDEQNNCMQ